MNSNNSGFEQIIALLFLFTVGLLGYWPAQSDFPIIISCFTVLFLLYVFIIKKLAHPSNFAFWVGMAILARVVLIFAIPNLSDDIYRFIWDGRLLNQGVHPFKELPEYYINNDISVPGIDQFLFNHLNSPNYFTIYPPVCQAIFGMAAWLFPNSILGSVAVMKSCLVAFEIGSIYCIIQLLKQLKLKRENVFWYALNPLIIIELTGNIHFEGGMVFFLALSLLLFAKNSYRWSAIAMGFAIATKLLPLMLLPFLFKRLGWRQSLYYFGMVGITVLVLFAPLFSNFFIANISSSINLYFQKFEFNASIYYLLRWLGFQLYGYNQIAFIGPFLASVVFIAIWGYAFFEKNQSFRHLILAMLFAFTLFLFCTTTVMPWYLSGMIFLSIFTRFTYPIWWSYPALWSYINYSYPTYWENLWVVGMEYVLVFGIVLWEYRRLRRCPH